VEPWAVAPAALADLRSAVSGRRVTPS